MKRAFGTEYLLVDTVGFIRNLPHHLIHAFRSTLDEAVFADVLMIVIDASDPEYAAQLDVTEKILEELSGAGEAVARLDAQQKDARQKQQTLAGVLLAGEEEISLQEGKLTVPPYGIAVLKE